VRFENFMGPVSLRPITGRRVDPGLGIFIFVAVAGDEVEDDDQQI
jgi:hypothetical protein